MLRLDKKTTVLEVSRADVSMGGFYGQLGHIRRFCSHLRVYLHTKSRQIFGHAESTVSKSPPETILVDEFPCMSPLIHFPLL